MSRFVTRIKDRIQDKRMESRQHDFVGEVAPSRLSATRDRRSLDQGSRWGRSSVSPTGSFDSNQSLGVATAGSDALDLEIRFISAQGLPRMDVVGVGCDPYFRAEIDDVLCYTSRALPNTLNPEWNEFWRIRNVPSLAILKVKVYDKDENQYMDDYVGRFKITDVYVGGLRDVPIVSLLRRDHGTFQIEIISKPAEYPNLPAYIFDGPCRYSIHLSPTVGAFTAKTTSARRYSTWKIYLKGIQLFFGNQRQHWNREYRAAQAVFSGPLSLTVRGPIIAGHRLLYARTTANRTGILHNAEDFWSLFRAKVDERRGQGLARLMGVNPDAAGQSTCPVCGQPASDIHSMECTGNHLPDDIPKEPGARTNASTGGRVPSDAEFGGVANLASTIIPHEHVQRIKPAVYTYIIDEDTFRFSETGAAFFVDFASKHALHSSCAETVRYAGEFHPRPSCGWADFDDTIPDHEMAWELWIDNGSGTYAPPPDMLDNLRQLLEYNWPGLTVRTFDFRDEPQKKSIQECRDYALEKRGILREELEPSVLEGESGSSLLKMATIRKA
ncbi:C2 domain-containing protein [Rhizoctonia solani]|uniref:C2 domain-containing protein n=1 Tax=Rhizoctonia solani TaxID=456999 RepID=A0A8H8SZW7_9AGAM|nr:C2 domain-containing protein [Rhizoctonia solani]QRW22843.1 C2 domain-containing protein [Rhizoctonia solani]